MSSARRNREHRNAPFTPMRCKFCEDNPRKRDNVYTTRSGISSHCRKHHKCWYQPEGDVYVPISEAELQAARERAAAGAARKRRRHDPITGPTTYPTRVTTVTVDDTSPVFHGTSRGHRRPTSPLSRRQSPPTAAVGRPPSSPSQFSEHSLRSDFTVNLTTAMLDPDLQVVGGLDRYDDDLEPMSPTLADLVDRLPPSSLLQPPSPQSTTPAQLDLPTVQVVELPAAPVVPVTAAAVPPPPVSGSSESTLMSAAPQPITSQRPLPPLHFTDLLTVVCTTTSDSIDTEVARLQRHHTINISTLQLREMLYIMHQTSRDVGRRLREMYMEQRTTGATPEDLNHIMLSAFDSIAEDHLSL